MGHCTPHAHKTCAQPRDLQERSTQKCVVSKQQAATLETCRNQMRQLEQMAKSCTNTYSWNGCCRRKCVFQRSPGLTAFVGKCQQKQLAPDSGPPATRPQPQQPEGRKPASVSWCHPNQHNGLVRGTTCSAKTKRLNTRVRLPHSWEVAPSPTSSEDVLPAVGLSTLAGDVELRAPSRHPSLPHPSPLPPCFFFAPLPLQPTTQSAGDRSPPNHCI